MIPIERLLQASLSDTELLPSDQQDRGVADILPRPERGLHFVLDHLRSAFNVGAIFRLADAVGATQVLLCGYTPTPSHPAVQKTAMSAADNIAWQHFERSEEALAQPHLQQAQWIALETQKNSPSLYQHPLQGPTVFVVGNERFGLSPELLRRVHVTCHIPMYGRKNSLNVGQALAVAAFEWSRQNPPSP